MNLNLHSRTRFVFILLLFFIMVVCNKEEIDPPPATRQECLDEAIFGDPLLSPYCLPYSQGESYEIYQTYCSPPPGSHEKRYAYDFLMPEGTEILAARAGVVVELREHWPGDNRIGGHENMVSLQHDDETIAVYIHLQQDGVDVELGDTVTKGGHLGWSGKSGDTNGVAHLHFQVCLKPGMCSYKTGEYTLPVNFSNADGPLDEAGGLMYRESYFALPCE